MTEKWQHLKMNPDIILSPSPFIFLTITYASIVSAATAYILGARHSEVNVDVFVLHVDTTTFLFGKF